MSAICGILSSGILAETDIYALRAMASALAHRGPDDSCAHLESRMALALRRGPAAPPPDETEPASNETGSVRVVLDGNIHNGAGLREDLLRNGHRFASGSASEVIAHAYEEYGQDFPRKLRGCFALALWDSETSRLLLVRDRSGERPLYYTQVAGRFIFASEIKAVLLHPDVERRLDPVSLHHSLTFMHVPGDTTMFQDIRKLPPAHMLIIEDKGWIQRAYWFPHHIRTEKKTTARDDAGEILVLLRQSVLDRIAGRGAAGAFLMGGIDSSAVAGLLSQALGAPINTFSIALDGPGKDDEEFIKVVSSHFGTSHTPVTVTSGELMRAAPDLLWHNDEPMMDPSTLPLYFLCRAAREKVSVALSGEGGDILFGGHDRYAADRYLHYYTYIPEGMRRNIFGPVLAMASHSAAPGQFQQRLEQLAMISPMSDAERHLSWQAFFSHHEKMSLYTPELARELRNMPSTAIMENIFRTLEKQKGGKVVPPRTRGFTEQQILADLLTLLPEVRLMSLDRAAAAAGVEILYPFLAKDIIELALSLPGEMKIKGATTKRVLKQAFWNFLPASVLYRHEQPLNAPLDDWFRGPLLQPARDILLDKTAKSRGVFNPAHIERLFREHSSGARLNGRRLWALFNIELWHRIFLDGPAPKAPRAVL